MMNKAKQQYMNDEGYITIEEYKANHMHNDPFIKDVENEDNIKQPIDRISKFAYAVNKQGDWYFYSQGYIDRHSVDELRDMAIYNR